MKKFIVLWLAVLILFITPSDGLAEEIKSTTGTHVNLMTTTNTEAGFACIVSETGNLYWEIGTDSFKDLIKEYNLDSNDNYAKIEVVPDNNEMYPYLYPEKPWKMLIYGTETPSWFNYTMETEVWNAHTEWKKRVYGMFDYQSLRNFSVTETTSIADTNSANYRVTEENIQEFLNFINIHNNLCTYIRTSVRNSIDGQIGTSIANDAWNYVTRDVGEQAKSVGNIGNLLHGLGVSNTGSVQNDFIGALTGYFFRDSIKQWNYYIGETTDYPYESAVYLWKHGLTVSMDSSGVWRLHSANGGKVLYSITSDEVSVKKAFACVVDEKGNIYWKQGVDNCDNLKSYYGLTSGEYVDIQVKPVLDDSKESLSLPDGQNPSVTRYFPYLDTKSIWRLTVLDATTPTWFTDIKKEAVMCVFNKWKTRIYENFDFKNATNVFTAASKNVSTYTNSDIELLKEWAIVWHKVVDQKANPTAAMKLSGYKNIGSSIWDDFDAYLLAAWRVQHTSCPGDIVSASYFAQKGITNPQQYDHSLSDIVGDSVSDAMESLTGYYVSTVSHWEYYTGDGTTYPFSSAAKLIIKGLVPFTDGVDWYLCSGENATIVYKISENDLLK